MAKAAAILRPKAPALIVPAHLGSGPAPIQTETRYPVFITRDNAPTLAFWQRCASIADPAKPVTVFLTASVWALMVGELCALPDAVWMDPTKKPTPDTFKALALTKKFTIVNSGTDDQAVCDEKNREAERLCSWRDRHDRFAMRAGTKDPELIDKAVNTNG
jgi:hypothetical protein